MEDLFIEHLDAFITALLSALLGWFFTRKKQRAELNKKQLVNKNTIVELYQESLDDLKSRYDQKFLDLEKDYNERIEELDAKVEALESMVEMWRGKYNILKADFDDYKKRHKASTK